MADADTLKKYYYAQALKRLSIINEKTSPGFKKRTASALKAGVQTSIKKFLDNPYINIGKAVVK